MNELDRWAEGYIEAKDRKYEQGVVAENHWAVQKFYDLEYEHPRICWMAILHILSKSPSDTVINCLAAGPLEDLIENHGVDIIADIELEAKENPKFRKMLCDVWESGSPDVWDRVLAARVSAWR